MLKSVDVSDALHASTQLIETEGRTLAYRSVGEGIPVVLCTRFRATLDDWDPGFLDALAGHGFRVITFDYSGFGRSTGRMSYNPAEMAADPLDLIRGLGLKDVVLGGWSIGGMAAQVAMVQAPDLIRALVLIGTTPPGELVKMAEPLFYELAGKEVNDFEDVVGLFFQPRSEASRAAAARSQARIEARMEAMPDDRSPPVPIEFARARIAGGPANPAFPAPQVLEALKTTRVPILHIGGDHDIIFPVENWYALNGLLPTTTLVTYPAAGHGPQHQHPELSAAIIAGFVGDH
ncbi:MAG: alpha/beta hydrolase [Roseovarius sp.]|uniref:alpha/beta fold hydrolase n=1 Tax=Roseovarius sp. TaxID=1486281 RepID=UPI0032ED3CCF